MSRTIKKSLKGSVYVGIIVLTAIGLMGEIPGCTSPPPIKVGFVGDFSGRYSGLGQSGRNGVLLAVEQINADGGINGRLVKLIVKDDRQNPEVAVQVDRELIDEGVAAIIGHMTSAMSLAALPLINREKVVMISPTSSTNKLTGIDDYFFRVISHVSMETNVLAHYAFKEKGLRRMTIMYDLSNQDYTEEWYNYFKPEFEKLGGTILLSDSFTSGRKVSYVEIAQKMLASNPDGIAIVAGAIDTAMICQQIRKLGSAVPIISCGWAMSSDLLQHGGLAVEGLTATHAYNKNSLQRNYLLFITKFKQRFGKEPNFAAVFGYEAAQILFGALQKDDSPQNLKATLLKQGLFQGLQGEIRIDPYGDTHRRRLLFKVIDGQFKTVDWKRSTTPPFTQEGA